MADIKVESAVMQLAAQHGGLEGDSNDDLEVVVERANNIELKLSTTELAGCAGSMQGVSGQESGSYALRGEVPLSSLLFPPALLSPFAVIARLSLHRSNLGATSFCFQILSPRGSSASS
jgi:hypothetical protein